MEDNRRKDKLQFLAEHLISLGFCACSLLIVCWNQVGWLPWLAGGFLLWWGVLWLLRTHNAWFRPKDKFRDSKLYDYTSRAISTFVLIAAWVYEYKTHSPLAVYFLLGFLFLEILCFTWVNYRYNFGKAKE